jgi:hypothetical protein
VLAKSFNGPRHEMTRNVPAALIAGLFAVCLLVFGSAVSWADGGSISILSTNTLSSGSRAIDYHPMLTVECKAGANPVLSQSIRIRDSVSGSGTIDVSVRADNGANVSEQWTLASNSRGFSTDGGSAAKRLTTARRLKFSWRFGLFSGRGEAIFDLAASGDALKSIVANCGANNS